MDFGQHPVMEEAQHANSIGQTTKEHDVPASLVTEKAGPNVLASSTALRQIGEELAGALKLIEIAQTLGVAPFPLRVNADVVEVAFGEES
jgi:hypothetical protein